MHRIGRTARAGAEGDAISFGCEEYAISLPEIEDYIGHKIPVVPVTPDLLAKDVKVAAYRPRPDGPRHGGSGGGRRGGPPRSGQSRSGGGGGGRRPPNRSRGGGSR